MTIDSPRELLELVAELEEFLERTRVSERIMRQRFARSHRSIPVRAGFGPGPDGVFWRIVGGRPEVVLVDNKAHGRPVVYSASGIEKPSLRRNLGWIIANAQRSGAPASVVALLGSLARWASSPSTHPPAGVRRVITNACGHTQRLGPQLRGFELVRVPHRRCPEEHRAAAAELADELEALERTLA